MNSPERCRSFTTVSREAAEPRREHFSLDIPCIALYSLIRSSTKVQFLYWLERLCPNSPHKAGSGTFPRQSASQNSCWSLQLCSYLWKYERNPNYTTGNGQMVPLNTHLSACYVPGCVLYPRNIK